jgi:hypothetical protein
MQQTLIYVNAAMSRNAGANLRPLMHGLVDSVVRGDKRAARKLDATDAARARHRGCYLRQ